MTAFDYRLTDHRPPQLGLIVLQADETIELDFRRLVPAGTEFFVTRIASGADLTPETLGAMEARLAASAGLLPHTARFAAIGYGCTSAAAQIGTSKVADLVATGARTRAVTDPVSALVAACDALGVHRLALLSPYVAPVSDRLRQVLEAAGLPVVAFGTFNEAEEARVARIAPDSIRDAARAVALSAHADALFLSCTNLRTLELIDPLEAELGLPVLSSNQVLAWHMLRCAGLTAPEAAPGRIFALHQRRG